MDFVFDNTHWYNALSTRSKILKATHKSVECAGCRCHAFTYVPVEVHIFHFFSSCAVISVCQVLFKLCQSRPIHLHLSRSHVHDHKCSVFSDHAFFRFLKLQQEKPICKQSCPNRQEMPSITFSRFRVRFSIGSLVPGRVGLATLPSGGTGAPRNLGPVPRA